MPGTVLASLEAYARAPRIGSRGHYRPALSAGSSARTIEALRVEIELDEVVEQQETTSPECTSVESAGSRETGSASR
jgi:hypothetical protein